MNEKVTPAGAGRGGARNHSVRGSPMRPNLAAGSKQTPLVAKLTFGALVALPAMTVGPSWGHGDSDGDRETRPSSEIYRDASGMLEILNVDGRRDTRGAFFQSLGTNGRTCATCHVASQAMTISPPQIRERYEATDGGDPLFASVDGANCSDVRREDRRGHGLLLEHGLIRVAIGIPASAQFTVSVVHDPYGCALKVDPKTGLLTASVYRRPLPAANLGFLSTVMWDGRETLAPLNSGTTFLDNLRSDLTEQAISAIRGHAQADKLPSHEQLADIVDFELGLYSAQRSDRSAGRLDRGGAQGGASNLEDQLYYPGVNDVLGADPTGTPFDSRSMTLFSAWSRNTPVDDASRTRARLEIAEGEKLFNTAPLIISNVRGLNDNAALNRPTSLRGTCTTCHDAPNVGHHSLPLPLDIGTGHTNISGLESDPAIARALSELDEPDLPVFLINGCPDPFAPGRPAAFYTTDPGKALLTGKCGDLNRLKGPILRGLAGRPPYFHNGAAANLREVVNFYDQRFQMKLTSPQKEALVAFLNSL